MGKKKNKGATWFKINKANKELFKAVDSKLLGDLFKMALDYFEAGEVTDIENMNFKDETAKYFFIPFKQSIDEALTEYQQAVEYGRKGGTAAHQKDNASPPNPL